MRKNKPPKLKAIRNRIKEYRLVPARSLIINPDNPRRHGKEQKETVRKLLHEIGIVAPWVTRETKEGLLVLDGELRTEIAQDMTVPVVVLADDVTAEEESIILATFNPVGELATIDRQALTKLIEQISGDGVVDDIMKRIHGDYSTDGVELRRLEEPVPPKMSWVLLGVPTVQYGEISAFIESLAQTPGVIIETTVRH